MKHVAVEGSTKSSVECVWLLPARDTGTDDDGRVLRVCDSTRIIRTAGAQFFTAPARLVRKSELDVVDDASDGSEECLNLVTPPCGCATDTCTLHVPNSDRCLLTAVTHVANGDRSGPDVQQGLTALLAAAVANNTPPPRPDALAIMFGLEMPPLPLPPDVLADGASILLRVLAVLPRQRFPWQ